MSLETLADETYKNMNKAASEGAVREKDRSRKMDDAASSMPPKDGDGDMDKAPTDSPAAPNPGDETPSKPEEREGLFIGGKFDGMTAAQVEAAILDSQSAKVFSAELRALNSRVRNCESVVYDLQAQLKDAKANLAGAIRDLRNAAEDADQPRLPLNEGAGKKSVDSKPASPEPVDENDAPGPVPEGTLRISSGEPAAMDEKKLEARYKRVRLDKLGLPTAVTDALATENLLTIGDVAKYCADRDRSLSSIKGIGPSKQKKIEEAMDAKWAEIKREAQSGEPVAVK